MKENIMQIKDAALKELETAQDLKSLNDVRVKYLGKKGELTQVLRGMGALSAEERPVIGSLVNVVRDEIEGIIKEKENLINVERPKVIEELQLARSQGDLSENADYDSARDKQAHIESRIKEIDQMLQHAQIIDESQMDTAVAKPGATVTVLDLSEEDGEPETYTIVGTFETDPLNGKISNESPLAKAIIDHGVNEIVSVGVAEPYEVKILKIEYLA